MFARSIFFICAALISAAVSAVSLFAQGADPPEGPTIIWSPEMIDGGMLAGGSVDVEFESNVDLEDVTVWLPPSIRPFITTTPDSYEEILAGEPQMLTIEIPDGVESLPHSIGGPIHLRNSGIPPRTYAKPLPLKVEVEGDEENDPENEEENAPAKITWSVEKIDESSFNSAVEVTFQSSSDLQDVIVWLTPSLTPFLTAEPAAFEEILAGTDYSFELILDPEINLEELERSIGGTVHIRQNGIPPRTYAPPLPVEINGEEEEEEPAPLAIVNSADFQAGGLAPGQVVTIFGSGLGPEDLAQAEVSSEGRLADYLGDTQVLFDGIPAPIVHSQDEQVSVVVPFEVAGNPTVEVLLLRKGKIAAPFTLPVVPAAPALFSLDASGQGQGAILNEDLSVNSAANPAAAGSVIVLFGTGAGETDPPGLTGALAGDVLPQPLLEVSVYVGGIPAIIEYAGAAPGLAHGILQVNARLQEGAPSGQAIPVVLGIGDQVSQPVTVAIE